jgi:hypothetical protein
MVSGYCGGCVHAIESSTTLDFHSLAAMSWFQKQHKSPATQQQTCMLQHHDARWSFQRIEQASMIGSLAVHCLSAVMLARSGVRPDGHMD